MSKYLIILSFLLISACASNGHNVRQETLEQYSRELNGLMEHLEAKKIEPKVAEAQAKELVSLGYKLLESYGKEHSDCRPLFNFLSENRQTMLDISLEDLERIYHEGEGLPEAEFHCFSAKEIVVHPATVISLSRQPVIDAKIKDQMKAELEELATHLDMFEEDSKHAKGH